MPQDIREQVKSIHGVTRLLGEAANACFEADNRADAFELIGRLYAGIAILVYELTESGGGDIIVGTSRA